MVHIGGDIYAIAYTGQSGDGFIKTIQITADGQISSATIDALEFDTSDCYEPTIIQMCRQHGRRHI